jgi:hypothetical protein
MRKPRRRFRFIPLSQKDLRHTGEPLFRPIAKNRERGQSPTQSGDGGEIGPNSLTLWAPLEKCLTGRWDQGWSSDPDAKLARDLTGQLASAAERNPGVSGVVVIAVVTPNQGQRLEFADRRTKRSHWPKCLVKQRVAQEPFSEHISGGMHRNMPINPALSGF